MNAGAILLERLDEIGGFREHLRPFHGVSRGSFPRGLEDGDLVLRKNFRQRKLRYIRNIGGSSDFSQPDGRIQDPAKAVEQNDVAGFGLALAQLQTQADPIHLARGLRVSGPSPAEGFFAMPWIIASG
jgi:hypothetical protein